MNHAANAAGCSPVAFNCFHVLVAVAAHRTRTNLDAHCLPYFAMSLTRRAQCVRDLVPDGVLNFRLRVLEHQYAAQANEILAPMASAEPTPGVVELEAPCGRQPEFFHQANRELLCVVKFH